MLNAQAAPKEATNPNADEIARLCREVKAEQQRETDAQLGKEIGETLALFKKVEAARTKAQANADAGHLTGIEDAATAIRALDAERERVLAGIKARRDPSWRVSARGCSWRDAMRSARPSSSRAWRPSSASHSMVGPRPRRRLLPSRASTCRRRRPLRRRERRYVTRARGRTPLQLARIF